jgi:hypothetical protein
VPPVDVVLPLDVLVVPLDVLVVPLDVLLVPLDVVSGSSGSSATLTMEQPAAKPTSPTSALTRPAFRMSPV